MIKASDLSLAGKVNKTHGLDGELSVTFFSDGIADAIGVGTCLIMDIDGIFTPFFVRNARPRGAESLLISFDGAESQEMAQQFVGKSIYALIEHGISSDDDEDGLYAGQIVGFKAIDDDNGEPIGIVEDIDDATENVLFIIRRPDGSDCRIPVVDDFIASVSGEDKTISFSLPPGLLDL
ncbi:MAG: ribosome maturation factor RimM [Clostridium sp.]|nr:ribosome maturation factor RimM [Clostridium sp.]